MSRTLPLTLESSLGLPRTAPPQFQVQTEVGAIIVRGHLSTGSRGWALRAEAACRRSVINLHVTAVEMHPQRVADLEHHEYRATLRVRQPGKYSLRVCHGFHLRGEAGLGLPHPVFEANLQVP
jgi:hypothetical protein